MTYSDSSIQPHSGAWIAFSYASFGMAILMFIGGLYFLQMDAWVKAYFGMGAVLLIQTCFTLAKTLRDVHEGQRIVNRLDHAKTDKLLSDAASR